jgi:hypothetical protein
MNSQIFLQLVQVCTILIGFLGVAVSLRSHRRQMYAQMYVEFSARLHRVLRKLPTGIWLEPPLWHAQGKTSIKRHFLHSMFYILPQ